MPYRVSVTARFEAAHNLIDYAGGPEPLHGHSYEVEAALETDKLQQYDLAIDFVAAKNALESIAKQLHYSCVDARSVSQRALCLFRLASPYPLSPFSAASQSALLDSPIRPKPTGRRQHQSQ